MPADTPPGTGLTESTHVSQKSGNRPIQIENVPLPLFLVDGKGDVIYVNDRFTRAFGYTLHEIPTLDAWWDKACPEGECHGNDGNAPREDCRQASRDLQDARPREISLRCRDGTRRTVIMSGILLDDYSLAAFIDITDRKRAEDALQQANTKLNLLSSITRHDMLNQLMVLKGFLMLSQNMPMDERLAGHLEKISRIADNLERQISFTRDYQNMGVKTPAWHNLDDVVGKNTEALSTGDIRVCSDCAAFDVYADPLFEKVFYNLIDNALKYGGVNLTMIRFSCREVEDGLHILCEDDGGGIPRDEKKHLFSRGFGKNTGLGLFLSREILAITGITIAETGEPARGARFEMIVPPGAYRHAAIPSP